jgi:hypothetical protein
MYPDESIYSLYHAGMKIRFLPEFRFPPTPQKTFFFFLVKITPRLHNTFQVSCQFTIFMSDHAINLLFQPQWSDVCDSRTDVPQ